MRPSSRNRNKRPPPAWHLPSYVHPVTRARWDEVRAMVERARLQPDRFYMTQRQWEEMVALFDENIEDPR